MILAIYIDFDKDMERTDMLTYGNTHTWTFARHSRAHTSHRHASWTKIGTEYAIEMQTDILID